MTSPISYTYDPNSRRYRASTGRYISAHEVRTAVDELLTAETATMRQYAQDLLDGKINFAEWQLRSLTTIKQLHIATALAGNGGRNVTSANDYSHIGTLLKEQYEKFRGMVGDIRKGKQLLNGTLLSRVALYGQAGRGSYYAMQERTARSAGLSESRRLLVLAEHCPGCISEARKGWGPIGHNKPIGTVNCKTNCKCFMEFR